MSTQFNLPYIDATRYTITKEAFNLLPIDFMKQFIIIDKIGSVLLIAISSPLNEKIFDEVEKTTSCQIFAFVSTSSQIKQAMQSVQGDAKKK